MPDKGQPPNSSDRHGREPKKHHYVPEFLLRAWTREWRPKQALLRGYYWDGHANQLRFRERGVGAFCYGLDLLTLEGVRHNRAILEARFFQSIDQKGREAINAMAQRGPHKLTADERCDVVRLMLSLEWRRPSAVEKLKREGKTRFAEGLDNDPEILAQFRAQGITVPPSQYAEKTLGWSFQDRALLIVQQLVDSKVTGSRLVNAHWHLRKLRAEHGSFAIGDRPLVRTHGLNHSMSTWFLPLSPKLGFFATLSPDAFRLIKKASAATILREANASTISQAERYVFVTEPKYEATLRAGLRPTEKP